MRRRVSEEAQAFPKAVEAYREGRFDEARSLCQALLARQPDFFDALHLQGVIAYRQGADSEAVGPLEAALRVQPGHIAVLVGLGLVRQRLRQFEAALAAFDEVLARAPQHVEALNNRGNVLMELRRPAEAVASFGLALALRPELADALKACGDALLELKRFPEALASFDKALVLKPDDAGTHNNRGTALKELNRNAEALASFDKALALKPDDAGAHNNRGNALKDLRRPAEALASYERAIALDPGYADVHNNKGLVLNDLGQLDAAIASIETAITLAPKIPRFYNHLSECKRFKPGDPTLEAMQALAEDLPALSTDEQIHLHFGLGKAYADVGTHDRAMRHWCEGNLLKRSQIVYNAEADLALLARTWAAFPPELLGARADRGDPSAAPIFILGMPRSGTTLVEQIVASHPNVFGAGETDELGRAVIKLSGTPLMQYSPDYLARLSGGQLRRFGASFIAHLQAAAPNAARITEKTPENFRFIGLIHMALPNARIIHTRRDPVDTCLSCFSKSFAGTAVPFSYDLAELGRFYRGYESLMAHWRAALPPSVMLDLDYEEVVADLEGQTRRILAHCGLGWDPRCLNFHKTERPVHTASRTQVRQPLFKSSVGRWRVYEPYLGPLLAAL